MGAKPLISASTTAAMATTINRDVALLHPILRASVNEILLHTHAIGMPFALFEGYRNPIRQDYLYAQGRTKPGKIVTQAKAGASYHQYGLAVDLVPMVDGRWTWDVNAEWWDQLQQAGEFYGLEGLSWEKPHLQVAGLKLADLHTGALPGGGDSSWWENLQAWRQIPVKS